eukprot:symbB.v1.2.027491.t1/scaffold2823.1/size69429/3
MAKWLLVCFWPLALAQLRAGVDVEKVNRCQPPSWLTLTEARAVYKLNCDKVQNATQDFNRFQYGVSDAQNVIWKGRSETATMLCDAARSHIRNNDVSTAARLAVQAWGQHIMNGTVCCPLPHAPFCLDTSASPTAFVVFGLFGWVILMFLVSLFASIFLRPPKEETDKVPTWAFVPGRLSALTKSVGVTVVVIGLLTWLKRRTKAAVTDGSRESATRGAVAVTTAVVPSSAARGVPPRPVRPAPRPQRSGRPESAEIFICLDFEWTCDDGEDRQVHSDDTEIIEFSYVIYDAKANRLACERQHYCKNQRTPLTPFCTELTGITEETLASAGSLADALEGLQRDLNDEQICGRRVDGTSGSHRAALHEILSHYGQRVGDDGAELNFEDFHSLAKLLQLPVAAEEEEKQKEIFAQLAKQRRGRSPDVTGTLTFGSFEDFEAWILQSGDLGVLQMQLDGLKRQQDEAALGAAAARVMVLLRPLGQIALIQALLVAKMKAFGVAKLCLLGAKKMTLLAKTKASLSLEAYMKSPTKLFRRQVISPLDPFRAQDMSTVDGVRKEFRESGLKGLSTKSIAPYLVNAGIAMVMFHTYTTTRLHLHALALQYPTLKEMPLGCEAISGASAGIMQATLHSPLYNVRLCREEELVDSRNHKTLGQRLRELHGRAGVKGCFQNYSFIMAQEVLALMSFFTSYEWLKLQTTSWYRQNYSSGEKDILGWSFAACCSGIVLSAVGTPFENILAWHVAHRQPSQPKGVWKHFLQEPPRLRMKIFFRGMGSKLMVAPLAGLPLLAYECMVHNEMAPRFYP